MKWLPYERIKEFYNVARNISPANRDMVLNSIFLGKSKNKGETLLDNMNYPFFDLWKYIISHYEQSVYETIRGELIVIPPMQACLPPLCNVIFPNEYIHFGSQIKAAGVITRYFEQGFFTTPGIDSSDNLDERVQVAQEAYIGPTSDIEPNIKKVIAGECTPKKLDKDTAGDEFYSFTQLPLPEEFHLGANYMTGQGEYLLKMGETIARKNNATLGEGESATTLNQEYIDFHKLNVLYKYFLTRLQSQKTEQVKVTFTPRLVPGLPILLLSRTGRHLIGQLTSVNHSISAEGQAVSMLRVEFQFLYDDATKRPLYFYRDRQKEQKLLEGKSDINDDMYIWKNHMMLSDNFRDKYIGKELYSTILCDGISDTDYNFLNNKTKKLQDKSILGIHKIFPDLKSSTKVKTKKDPIVKQSTINTVVEDPSITLEQAIQKFKQENESSNPLGGRGAFE